MNTIDIKVLESLMITTEGFFDRFKKNSTDKSNNTKEDTPKYDFVKELNNKYHCLDSQEVYDKFINKMLNEIEREIKKMVSVANRDTVRLNKLRTKLKEEWDWSDSELRKIKSGFYKCDSEGDQYWIIIDSQAASIVDDLHNEIAEALNKKAETDIRYKLFHFDTGDGDEGCVYYTYLSYETIKKYA